MLENQVIDRVKARPEQDPDGALIGFIGTVLDITEGKVAEAALRQRESHHQAILNAIPDLMLRVQPDGTCLECILPKGDKAGVFLPVTQHLSEVLPPPLLQQQLHLLEQALATGRVQVLEHAIEKQGQICYEEVRISPISQAELLLIVRDITAQKQAEIDRNRIFELSLDLIAVIGFDGYFQQLNPAWEKTLGYNRKELMADPYVEFIHPEDRDRTLAEAAKVKTGQDTLFFQNRYRCRDGSYRWLSWNATPVPEEERIYCVARDITEQKQFGLALRQSEERYRSLVANLPGVVYRCHNDADWNMEFLCDAIQDLCGYPATDFIQGQIRTYSSIIHPDDRARVETAIQSGLDQRQPFGMEYRIQHRDGSLRWVYERGQGVFHADGRLNYLDGVIFDITDRKQLEMAQQGAQTLIQKREEQLRLALDLNHIGMWECPLDQGGVTWSDHTYRLLGYEPGEVEPGYKSWLSRVYPGDLAAVEQRITHALATQTDYADEYRVILPDGSIGWRFSKGRGVYDESGRPVRIIGVTFDISDRKQAEAALALAEANYRSIFENSLEGIFQSTPDGQYLRVNAAMARIHGYESPEEMMALVQEIGHQIYVDPACRNEFLHLIETQGEVKGLQYQVYWRDGQPIWVEENTRAVHDADGRLLYFEGFIVDITDRKREEQALRSQLQALRIEIDQQKRQRDVTQIIQTDYFQQLQADLDRLRDEYPS